MGAPRNCAGYAPSFPPRSLLWCALNALSVPNAQSHQVNMDEYGPANVLWWKSWCTAPPQNGMRLVGLNGKSYPEWSSTVSKSRTVSHAQSVTMCFAKNSGPSNVPMPRKNVSTGCAYSAAMPNGCVCSW